MSDTDEGLPRYAYRREVYVEGLDGPLVDLTTDYRTWDRWVDELDPRSDARPMPGTAEVRLYSAALDWSHDLTPQLRRVIERAHGRNDARRAAQ